MDQKEVVKLKEWLDWHVADIKAQEERRCFNRCIKACRPKDWIQLARGIDLVADMLGAELNTADNGRGYREYSFQYNGVTVLQLEAIEDEDD